MAVRYCSVKVFTPNEQDSEKPTPNSYHVNVERHGDLVASISGDDTYCAIQLGDAIMGIVKAEGE